MTDMRHPDGHAIVTEKDVFAYLVALKQDLGPGHLQLCLADGDPPHWRFWAWSAGKDSIKAGDVETLRTAVAADTPLARAQAKIAKLEAEAAALRAQL